LSSKSFVSDIPTDSARTYDAGAPDFVLSHKTQVAQANPIGRRAAEARLFLVGTALSAWTQSGWKRAFDLFCVISMLPILIPLFVVVAFAVRLTSSGPILFLQRRVGRGGHQFTILKFRTMVHNSSRAHQAVTTAKNQRFTSIGQFLRRYKLDELPQVINILSGQMSLVGPRPKLAQHAISCLSCRTGITGAATIAFACEEAVLEKVPKQHLDSFYHSVVLPAKHNIDIEYMANATFSSDLKLIVRSVLRQWDTEILDDLLAGWAAERGIKVSALSTLSETESNLAQMAKLTQIHRTSANEEVQVTY
jgi:lipopolysaccharide/colanic/teichoic acid biosynthesis glycosyltransferase